MRHLAVLLALGLLAGCSGTNTRPKATTISTTAPTATTTLLPATTTTTGATTTTPLTTTTTGATTTTPLTTTTAGATTTATTSAITTSVPPAAVAATLVGRADQPMAMVNRPNSDGFLLAEREGRIRAGDISGNGSLIVGETLLDLTEWITTTGEGGLLGLTISKTGHELFVNYTGTDWISRVSAYPLVDGRPVTGKEGGRPLLDVAQPYPNHNGGHLLVDGDGHLLVGFGDGGWGGDPHGHGQDTSTLLGAILRINPTAVDGRPYRIPLDNPFVDNHPGTRPEILAYGLRNPWRFDLDPSTGDLWIADVGQDHLEEINLLPAVHYTAGADFGWASMEGTRKFAGSANDGHRLPVHEYSHGDGRCSIIGGVIVRAGNLKELDGAFLYSDFCDGRIRALLPDGGDWADHDLEAVVELPVSFTRASDGTIYILSATGGIFRLDNL